jgi:serine/threonine protein kinase
MRGERVRGGLHCVQMIATLPQQIGPYRVLGRLAVGGMGEVLLGHDDGLDRPVAIKRLRAEVSHDGRKRDRFRREAKLAARLDHSAIVRVYDLVADGDIENIVMEYVEGKNLRFLLKGGPFPVRYALCMASEIAQGLQHAHDRDIVHRDLKSENILVTPDAHAKITDFGIAKHLLAGDEALTHSSAVLGTIRAMSPEQALGQPIDPRSDLFSFGVLLYELVSGRSPFETTNDLVTLKRLTTDPHPPLSGLDPEIPHDLVQLIDRLLEKKPEHRPATAREVSKVLHQIAFQLEPGLDLGEFVRRRSRWRRSLMVRAWRALRGRFKAWRDHATTTSVER